MSGIIPEWIPVPVNQYRKSMDFDVLAYLSWREVLVAVVVLLVLYGRRRGSVGGGVG